MNLKTTATCLYSLFFVTQVLVSQEMGNTSNNSIKPIHSENLSTTGVFAGKGNEIYQINVTWGEIDLRKFDQSFNLIKEGKSDLKLEYSVNEGLFLIGTDYYLFLSRKDPRNLKSKLYRFKLNKELLTFDEGQVVYECLGEYNHTSYDFSYSNDSSLLLISVDQVTFYPKVAKKRKYDFVVFNTLAESIWLDELSICSKTVAGNYYQSILIGNNGKMFLLEADDKDNEKAQYWDYNFSYKIHQFNLVTKEYKVIKSELESSFFKDSQLRLTPQGNMILTGFYSVKGKYQGGVFYKEYDHKTNKVLKDFKQNFSAELVLKYESENERNKAVQKQNIGKEFKLIPFKLNQILFSERSITLIAEQYQLGFDSNTGKKLIRNANILVSHIEVEGERISNTILPKNQYCKNRDWINYTGYGFSRSSTGNLYFIFNDSPKNYNATSSGKVKQWSVNNKTANLTVFTVNKMGVMTHKILARSENDKIIAEPKGLYQFNSNSVIFGAWSKKNKRFFTIELP